MFCFVFYYVEKQLRKIHSVAEKRRYSLSHDSNLVQYKERHDVLFFFFLKNENAAA